MKNLTKKQMICLTVASLLVFTLIGCGFVASVPWIRNAQNNKSTTRPATCPPRELEVESITDRTYFRARAGAMLFRFG